MQSKDFRGFREFLYKLLVELLGLRSVCLKITGCNIKNKTLTYDYICAKSVIRTHDPKIRMVGTIHPLICSPTGLTDCDMRLFLCENKHRLVWSANRSVYMR
jgi:hypothetical protein